jgi:hypothetical protein
MKGVSPKKCALDRRDHFGISQIQSLGGKTGRLEEEKILFFGSSLQKTFSSSYLPVQSLLGQR